MRVVETKRFRKQLTKLNPKIKEAVKNRLWLLSHDKSSSTLNNHKLHGKYSHYRSINISGDIRLVFEMIDGETIFLIAIGSHHDLYE